MPQKNNRTCQNDDLTIILKIKVLNKKQKVRLALQLKVTLGPFIITDLALTKNKKTNFYMRGKELIQSHLSSAPDLPGVYRMLGADKNILYIGKAKNLKNRLSQYTLELSGKNKIMVSLVRELEYSVTYSESDALLLEGQLIKKFKPKFNILLKDDKSFPYIKLRLDHDYPQLL